MNIDAPWAVTAEEAGRSLDSRPDSGLSSEVATQRLREFGPNRLREHGQRTWLGVLLSQFQDLMVVLLLAAAAFSAWNGELADAVLIGLIVIVNAVVGAAQEWKADNALEALKSYARPTTRVRRNGAWSSIPAEDLVPGDIVEVRTGDIAPADSRILSSAALEVDESPLTGESLPVEKSADPVARDAPLPDRTCMLHAGTSVQHGHGESLVIGTGMNTEIGRIAAMLAASQSRETPLQLQLKKFNRWIAAAVLLICVGIFAVGVLREPPENRTAALYGSMLLIAVSLAVAAIPEGLPAIMTVTLALGSQRMARRNAIIRQLSAVEALGSVDVICSDKTGTLTENKMRVAEVAPARKGDQGKRELLEAVALCNDAKPEGDGILGSATEVAMLAAAQQAGIDVGALRKSRQRIGEVPFSSAKKRMTTIHAEGDGQERHFIKGAFDQITELCQFSQPQDKHNWLQRAEELAGQGQRVLAVATKMQARRETTRREEEAENPGPLEFLGLISMVDPPRPEAKAAIARCREAGIRAIMITGDHSGTAAAVAAELDLFPPGKSDILTGKDLDGISDDDLPRRLETAGAFARVSPHHKLRIVTALQSLEHAVAMTGDGVNDAPALKQADVGVAMGITGTDVSRQAARIVLTDDNFATIVAAVEEGRAVYSNIRKFIAYLLAANFSEVLVLLGALLLGMPLPLLPVHLLWINLVTDGLPALALGFEPGEPNAMRRPPRKPSESIFADGLGTGIFVAGTIMAVLCLLIFHFTLGTGVAEDLNRARTLTFLTLSYAQLFFVCGMRSFSSSLWQLGLFTNWRLAGAVALGALLQLAVLYVPFLRRAFHATPLSMGELALVVGTALLPLMLVEGWKWVRMGGK